MRRTLLLVVLAATAAFFMAESVGAGKQDPLDWLNASANGQSTLYVEQQNDWPLPDDPALRVVNPLPGCAWDVNDRLELVDRGYLDPGVTVTKQVCMIADHNPTFRTVHGLSGWWSSERGRFGFDVRSSSAGLSVSACYQPQGRCFTASPVWDQLSRTYGWRLCSQVVYLPDDPALAEIPGSNGGVGVVSTVTTTITNTNGRRIRDVRAAVGVQDGSGLTGPPIGPGCADVPPTDHVDYPFTWDAS